MGEDIRVLTSVGTTAEADIIIALLLDAGIHVMPQRKIGGPEWGMSGARDVYVSERDYERARELLKSDENAFSDEELTRLSEEAGCQNGEAQS